MFVKLHFWVSVKGRDFRFDEQEWEREALGSGVFPYMWWATSGKGEQKSGTEKFLVSTMASYSSHFIFTKQQAT